jgi:hypothetical protein
MGGDNGEGEKNANLLRLFATVYKKHETMLPIL